MAASIEERVMKSVAARYALAPVAVVLAILLHLTPIGEAINLPGLFVVAVLVTAGFGGPGPGLLAAVLGAFTVTRFVPTVFPLLGGLLDGNRLISFSVVGFVVGWWSLRRRQVEVALRESGERYALAMEAAGDGHTDWNLENGEHYISPRLLQICGYAPGTTFRDREEWVRRFPFHPEDRPKWEQAVAAHMAGRESHFKMELRIVVNGEVRWTAFHFLSGRNAAGKPIRWTGSIADITEQKRVEEALRASEERISLAMEASEEGYIDCDVPTDRFIVSERMREIFEVPAGTRITYRSDFNEQFRFCSDEDARVYGEAMRTLAAQGGPNRYEFEFRVVLPSGKEKWIWTRSKVTRDAEGRAIRRIGVVADVTARKQAEAALRESEDRFARAVAGSSDGVWDIDFAGRSVFFSARTRELCGLPPGPSVVPLDGWFESLPLHPDDLPRRFAAVSAHLSGQAPAYDGEFRFLQPDGVYRWRHLHGVCVRDASGKPLRMAGSMSDVDARRRAEDALRESEQRYELAMAASESGYWDWDVRSDRYFVSPRAFELNGYDPGTTWVSREEYSANINMHPDDLVRWEAARQALFAGTGDRISMQVRYVVGGQTRWHILHGICRRDEAGNVVRWTGSTTDITDRQLAEEALRESERRYELAMGASESGYWDWFVPTDQYLVSPRALEMGGYDRPWANRNDFSAHNNMHPEDFRRWELAREELFAGTGERLAMEVRYLVRGETRWHALQAICLRDESGKVIRWTGSQTDVTDRRRAEDELKAMELKLRQAQRLEAMGTLAGGIAHDFNNILGAILGYGEMALRDVPAKSRLARDLGNIMIAGERGRALVDRVLAFSRSAVGERVPVHVEGVVREVLDLVSAKLPPNVTLHPKLHAGRAAILGDATQVHQVVANLATNAVQAMPAGGTLSVRLATERVAAARATTIGELRAEEYVVLAVADTGTGIAPEIVDRIFDPFFTTKEVGTGTGLGLSLVHGIVTELDGAIDVQATPGAGTTFTIYVPRNGDAAERSEGHESQLPRGAGQHVLVVDDEEPLVELATRTLSSLGYAPVGFTSSAAALAAFRAEPGRFAALVTDERMPEMSGSALIREVRGMRDSFPVLLMSGYVGGSVATGADEILQKPVSASDLATSLARVLQL